VIGAAPQARELLPDLFGALVALKQDANAGPVVALGHDEGGIAALQATSEEEASAHLGPEGPRFAAAVSLGPDAVHLIAGRSGPDERWAERAVLLCQAFLPAITVSMQVFLHDCFSVLVSRIPSKTAGRLQHAGAP
jgi:hypothetical protein